MAINFHVQGRRPRTLFTHLNTSLLQITLKQYGIKEIRSSQVGKLIKEVAAIARTLNMNMGLSKLKDSLLLMRRKRWEVVAYDWKRCAVGKCFLDCLANMFSMKIVFFNGFTRAILVLIRGLTQLY
ncbi:hypothetical protein FEM48_ZijujUnG0058100 [Ziziphus jujuba var. spinosa]|uniref:Uncharacterized protein n=1 Tax=Ziziphus jujuba var. spinosa TaxID=714518 RepID=A0A978U911_ZIZJJ|nr:hypothetical protein FEM48_ZijujUnG0058100 [Ziziphus jujuba var. spinosa]